MSSPTRRRAKVACHRRGYVSEGLSVVSRRSSEWNVAKRNGTEGVCLCIYNEHPPAQRPTPSLKNNIRNASCGNTADGVNYSRFAYENLLCPKIHLKRTTIMEKTIVIQMRKSPNSSLRILFLLLSYLTFF